MNARVHPIERRSSKAFAARSQAHPAARSEQAKALAKADEFTLIVERYMRSDLPDGIAPASYDEVVDALYELRADIARAIDHEGEQWAPGICGASRGLCNCRCHVARAKATGGAA